jgi:hypothetical protein
VVRDLGVQPTLWNWDYRLAPSPYSGDLDVIPYHRSSLLTVFAATLATLFVPVPFSLQATDYGDTLLGSRKAHTHYWEDDVINDKGPI